LFFTESLRGGSNPPLTAKYLGGGTGRHAGLRKKFFEINVTTDFFSSV
jgi:hypothetical protein